MLEAALASREAALASLLGALRSAAAACEGHGSIEAACAAADDEALAVGAEVAKLEEQLSAQRAAESAQLSHCERLAGEARALRTHIPLVEATVEALRRRAEAEGIVVDLAPVTAERAVRRFRERVEADCAMLRELRREALAMDEAIAVATAAAAEAEEDTNSDCSVHSTASHTYDARSDAVRPLAIKHASPSVPRSVALVTAPLAAELAALESQEATLGAEVATQHEAIAVNDEVIAELGRQLAAVRAQLAALPPPPYHQPSQRGHIR